MYLRFVLDFMKECIINGPELIHIMHVLINLARKMTQPRRFCMK